MAKVITTNRGYGIKLGRGERILKTYRDELRQVTTYVVQSATGGLTERIDVPFVFQDTKIYSSDNIKMTSGASDQGTTAQIANLSMSSLGIGIGFSPMVSPMDALKLIWDESGALDAMKAEAMESTKRQDAQFAAVYAGDEQTRRWSEQLDGAKKAIEVLTATLERVKKDPLMLTQVHRLSKDKKWAFIKKGEQEIRIEACPDLEQDDEVLLHPKSHQIVERLGRPPLEVSPFSPANVPDVSWDDIGGLEAAKADMLEAIELPHSRPGLFQYYGQRPIKGILLSGPPGCGKTMLGKAAATALSRIYGRESARTGFLYVKGPEILNQYVGQTEQTIRNIFYDARRHREENGYPAVLFFDEADSILAARGSRLVGIGNTIVPMFLTEMDGLEESSAIVIIATNRPDVLDPAIVRDGRIDRKVTVTRPDEKSALQILRLNLRCIPLADMSVDDMAAEMCRIIYSSDTRVSGKVFLRDIVSGAMLANCVNIAVSNAINRDISTQAATPGSVTVDDARAAIHRVQVQAHKVLHDVIF